MMKGKTIVAFADTLFRADFKLEDENDGIIWVQKVDDPSAFGVVQLDEKGYITDFVEKPQSFVSDMAIIGIYYFKDGAYLKDHLQYLIDHDIKDKGEYQITDALQRMRKEGTKFKPGAVKEWLDCGNKNATVNTNQRVLEFIRDKNIIASSATIENSTIIEPCYIGQEVKITNSVVGPHVSLGDHSQINRSVISNSIIQKQSKIEGMNLQNSMVGNHTSLAQTVKEISIGDYNQWEA